MTSHSDFLKEVEEMFKEDTVPIEPKKQVDWEKLSLTLEAALTSEIADNKTLSDKLFRLEGIEHHVTFLEKENRKLRDQLMQQLGVITYLEKKIGNDSV